MRKSLGMALCVWTLCGALGCNGETELTDRPEVPAGQTGCTVIAGPPGSDEFILRCADGTESRIQGGEDGAQGESSACSVTDHEDGTKTIACEDGTSVVVEDGAQGEPGQDGEPGKDGEPGEDGSSCTAEDHGDGTKTISCEDGTRVTVADGVQGAMGEPGEMGEAGEPGEPGQDGTSCSVVEHGDGTKTVSCSDGTSAVLHDGMDGVDGEDGTSCTVEDHGDGTKTISCSDGTSATVADGEDGADGLNGTDGMNGEDGTSCSVTDHGDGSKTITCEDGTSVVVRDGVDGEDGTDGTNGVDGMDGKNVQIVTTPEAAGTNCAHGGTKIEFFIEGETSAAATTYQCDTPANPCQPGWIFSSSSQRCVAALVLRWEGLLGSYTDTQTLPGNAATTETLVTEGEALASGGSATPCSGEIVYALDAVDPDVFVSQESHMESDGMSYTYDSSSAHFELGYDGAYRVTSSVGGSFVRSTSSPVRASDLIMNYNLATRFDGVSSEYRYRSLITMAASAVDGFTDADFPSLYLNLSGEFHRLQDSPRDGSAPALVDWLDAFAGVQGVNPDFPDAYVEFNSYGMNGTGGYYRCRITLLERAD